VRVIAFAALLTALAAAALAPARSEAARKLDVGFADYLYNEEGEKGDREFRLTKSVNASVIRVNLYWNRVATSQPANPRDPADPAYNWAQYDRAISRAAQYGFQVDLTVLAAPPWAEGPNRPSLDQVFAGAWKPDADKFGDFAHALAERYSGHYDPAADSGSGGGSGGGGILPVLPRAGTALPAVKYFEAWNEPNLATYLMPQWQGKKNVATDLYVKLLNSFYDEVKAVNPNAKVVVGGTAPYGDPPGGPNRTQPIRFYQELLCLSPKNKKAACPAGQKPKFDIIAHHPINREDPPTAHALNKGDVEVADMRSLVKVLRKAEHLHTPATGGRHDVWANEVWWQTNPPDKREGIPLRKHALWTEQAMYLLWKQGVDNVTFLQFRDAKYTPGEPTLASYQTGVYTYAGKRKPTANAVAFPFVTDRRGKRVLTWGRAPASGTVKIQVKSKGKGKGRAGATRFRRAASIKVKKGQVFTKHLRLGDGKHVLRAKLGKKKSLPWPQR
jgi:hypothetical protein